MRWMLVWTAMLGVGLAWTASTASALPVDACCKSRCADPAWTACENFICTSGVKACLSGYSETEVPGQLCGSGASADCPATETGQCADGVNNDIWTETGEPLVDCQDPDCTDDPACRLHGAPALGLGAAGLLAGLLGLAGAVAVRRRARH